MAQDQTEINDLERKVMDLKNQIKSKHSHQCQITAEINQANLSKRQQLQNKLKELEKSITTTELSRKKTLQKLADEEKKYDKKDQKVIGSIVKENIPSMVGDAAKSVYDEDSDSDVSMVVATNRFFKAARSVGTPKSNASISTLGSQTPKVYGRKPRRRTLL